MVCSIDSEQSTWVHTRSVKKLINTGSCLTLIRDASVSKRECASTSIRLRHARNFVSHLCWMFHYFPPSRISERSLQIAWRSLSMVDKLPHLPQVSAPSNKCIASSNKCLTSSNKNATRAPGIAIRSKDAEHTSRDGHHSTCKTFVCQVNYA